MNSFNALVINGIYHFSFLYLRNISPNLLPSSGQFDRVAIIFHSVCKYTFFPSWLRGYSSSLYTFSYQSFESDRSFLILLSFPLSFFLFYLPPPSTSPPCHSQFLFQLNEKDRVLFSVTCNRRDLSRDNL